jgi:hypothetical protein
MMIHQDYLWMLKLSEKGGRDRGQLLVLLFHVIHQWHQQLEAASTSLWRHNTNYWISLWERNLKLHHQVGPVSSPPPPWAR